MTKQVFKSLRWAQIWIVLQAAQVLTTFSTTQSHRRGGAPKAETQDESARLDWSAQSQIHARQTQRQSSRRVAAPCALLRPPVPSQRSPSTLAGSWIRSERHFEQESRDPRWAGLTHCTRRPTPDPSLRKNFHTLNSSAPPYNLACFYLIHYST